MVSSKNQSNLKELIYETVKQIPKGKVATYGQIAGMIQSRDHSWSVLGENDVHSRSVATGKHIEGRNLSRFVGWMLHLNKDSKVPCHRVVDRNGRLAPNFAFSSKGGPDSGGVGWREQKRRLEAEGVKFVNDKHVDLDRCLWR